MEMNEYRKLMESLDTIEEVYANKANTNIELVYSIKPNDPAQALIYLNAKNVPLGEAPAADFKEDEYKHQMEKWIIKSLQRASGRFTKQFSATVEEGQYNGSSNSLLNSLEAMYGEDVINDFDSIKLNTDHNQYVFKPTKKMHNTTYYKVFKNHNFMGEFETPGILRLIKKNEPDAEVNEARYKYGGGSMPSGKFDVSYSYNGTNGIKLNVNGKNSLEAKAKVIDHLKSKGYDEDDILITNIETIYDESIEEGKGDFVRAVVKNGKPYLKMEGMSQLVGIGDWLEYGNGDASGTIIKIFKNSVRLKTGDTSKIYKLNQIRFPL